MTQTIDKVITKVFPTKSANTTYATDIPVRYYEQSQQFGIEFLQKVCDYTDHIFYEDSDTFHFVDLLTGSTEVTVTDFQILDMSSQSEDSIVSKIRAEWTMQKYDESSYQLKEASQSDEVSTGLGTGSTMIIDPMNYIKSEISDVLDRKKELYLKDSITIKLGTVQFIKPGQKIILDSAYATGSFVVQKPKLTRQGDEILTGLGTITYT